MNWIQLFPCLPYTHLRFKSLHILSLLKLPTRITNVLLRLHLSLLTEWKSPRILAKYRGFSSVGSTMALINQQIFQQLCNLKIFQYPLISKYSSNSVISKYFSPLLSANISTPLNQQIHQIDTNLT